MLATPKAIISILLVLGVAFIVIGALIVRAAAQVRCVAVVKGEVGGAMNQMWDRRPGLCVRHFEGPMFRRLFCVPV